MNRKKAPFYKKRVVVCLLFLLWVFCSSIASQYLIGYPMLWILGSTNFQLPIWTTVYSALTYILTIVLVVVVPAKLVQKQKINRNELGLTGLPTWTDLGLAPVGFIVQFIIAAILVWVFSLIFPWFDANETQNVGYNLYMSGSDRIVAFISLVVIAPIAEEVVFRGWLYGKLRARCPMWAAIFLVSLLFGFIHLQWNVGVNVFALSVVLCGLREITGTIYSGIVVHMIKNCVAFYLLYVVGVA